MTDIVTKKEPRDVAEIYEEAFQPNIYCEMFYSRQSANEYTNLLGMLHKIFTIDIKNAESMIDLGCGPTFLPAMSASRIIKRIVCSDLLDRNLQEVRKWLNGEVGAHDWSSYFEEVAKLEIELDLSKLEKRVRNSIKNLIHCDVKLPNPIAPHTDHFDVVYTCEVYESVATSEEELTRMIANSASLLNDGGHFIYAGYFNSREFYLGDVLFPAYPFDKDKLNDALVAAKLKPLLWTIFPLLENSTTSGDFGNRFLVLAKKIKAVQ